MSRFAVGNVFLVVSMVCTTASHVVLKGLLDELGGDTGLAALREFLTPMRIVRGVAAGTLVVSGFVCWMLCLMRLPLSYAYPVSSVTVLLVALFSILVLGETMSPRMWAGTVLVFIGIAMLRPDGAG